MRQIQLGNTFFEGLNNVYVLGAERDEPTTLVDTGVSTPDIRDYLAGELSAFGLGFADIEEIVLTHWHADHVGLAGTIQADGGATVHAHAEDAPLIEQDPTAWGTMQERQHELFDEWGMPDGPRAELVDFLEGDEALSGDPPTVEPFEAGARFDVGGLELEAVHLPGHTAGLTGFAFETDRGTELFSGDALLPYYTPNVGGADTRVDRPLAKYLDTLTRIIDRDDVRAWPGHRGAIIDPAGRAADVITHHRERTDRVVRVLDEHGPADAWTVSAHLFGDLESIHILHGPGEAYAHLEHLEDAGIVERTPEGYALVERDPDLDGLFPEVAVRAQRPENLPGPLADD